MNILLASFEGIGNTILCTPAIFAIRKANPKAFIGLWVAKKRGTLCLTKGLPVDKIYTSRPDKNFNIGVNFFNSHTIPCCDFQIKIPNPGLWNFTENERFFYMRFAKILGYRGKTPPLYVPKYKTSYLKNIKRRKIAVGIGYLKRGNWALKHYGNKQYIKLIRKLTDLDYHCLLVGNKADWLTDGIVIAEHIHSKNFQNFSGQIGKLKNTIGLVDECDAYLGNDTSIMHIANAQNKHTLGIFTKRSNPIKNAPLGKKGHYMVLPKVQDVVKWVTKHV